MPTYYGATVPGTSRQQGGYLGTGYGGSSRSYSYPTRDYNTWGGGATGLESDLALRNQAAQQMMGGLIGTMSGDRYASLTTDADRARAVAGYAPLQQQWQGWAQTGGYTPEAMRLQGQQAFGNVTAQAAAANTGMMNQLAQRGMGGNPMASAAIGSQGMMNAGAAQASQMAALQAEQIRNMLAGLQGLTGVQGQLAGLYMTPTQETAQQGAQNFWNSDALFNLYRRFNPGAAGWM